jgi:hypothetical protein
MWLPQAKLVLPVVFLAVFWVWETWWPLVRTTEGRLSHAGRNLAIAAFNAAAVAMLFSAIRSP